MSNLLLNCVVLYDRVSTFSINVPSTNNIAQLKNAINIAMGRLSLATSLTIWQANIPIAASMGQFHHLFRVLNDGNDLNPAQSLQQLFHQGAAQGFIHIVVRWQDLLSEREFVALPLDGVNNVTQGSPGARADTTRRYSLTPHAVSSWIAFLPSVNRMPLAGQALYSTPAPYVTQIIGEVDLRTMFKENVGSVKCLPPFATTQTSSGFLYGIPDLDCSCVGADGISRVIFPIEIKMTDVLHLADGVSFRDAYRERDSEVQGPAQSLNQLYGYLKHNGYRYGVLSTYTQTWFVKIDGENDDELLVSPTISFNGVEPTLLQCYLWLIRTASINGQMDISDNTTAHLVRTMKQINKDLNRVRRKTRVLFPRRYRVRQSAKIQQGFKIHQRTRTTRWIRTTQGYLEQEQVTIPAFKSMELLSQGEAARTFHATWKDLDVVVKKADLWSQRLVVRDLENEERIYRVLKTLQGRYIPRMKMAGILNGMEMVLATEFVGNDLGEEHLDSSDRNKIRKALWSIHRLGVLHGDISEYNIVVDRDDENSQFFFIDFGLATMTRSRVALECEALELEELLDSIPWP